MIRCDSGGGRVCGLSGVGSVVGISGGLWGGGHVFFWGWWWWWWWWVVVAMGGLVGGWVGRWVDSGSWGWWVGEIHTGQILSRKAS